MGRIARRAAGEINSSSNCIDLCRCCDRWYVSGIYASHHKCNQKFDFYNRRGAVVCCTPVDKRSMAAPPNVFSSVGGCPELPATVFSFDGGLSLLPRGCFQLRRGPPRTACNCFQLCRGLVVVAPLFSASSGAAPELLTTCFASSSGLDGFMQLAWPRQVGLTACCTVVLLRQVGLTAS